MLPVTDIGHLYRENCRLEPRSKSAVRADFLVFRGICHRREPFIVAVAVGDGPEDMGKIVPWRHTVKLACLHKRVKSGCDSGTSSAQGW